MNGGIIGKKLATRRGVWLPEDVAFQVNGLRLPDVVSGLVHRYPLTADANDVIGTAHLTNNNAVTFSELGASFLRSSTQYLSATLTLPATWTWSWLFKAPTPGSGENHCFVGASGANVENAVFVEVRSGPTMAAFAYATGSYNDKIVDFDLPGWHHAAVTGVLNSVKNSTIVRVFFDGQESMQFRNTASSYTLSNNFAIGRVGGYDGDYLTGCVRDFRIFDRTLALAEIETLARRG